MNLRQSDLRVTGGTVKFHQPKQVDDHLFLDECPVEVDQIIDFNDGSHAPFKLAVKEIEQVEGGWQITLENRDKK